MSAERNVFTRLRDLFNRRTPQEKLVDPAIKESLVLDIDDSKWEEFMKSPRVVLVLGAPGSCGPCHRYEPIVEQLAEAFPDVKFGGVDLDKGRRSKAKRAYPHMTAIPLTVLFREGQNIGSFLGSKSFEEASDHIRNSFAQHS